jgi:hypothetical protein
LALLVTRLLKYSLRRMKGIVIKSMYGALAF